VAWAALFTVAAAATGAALAWTSSSQQAVLLPTIAACVLYFAFTLVLYGRVRQGLFGEIGFLFLSIALAYTIMPAATFLLADLELSTGWVWQKLSRLLPDRGELGLHLWRHVLFIAGTAVGYLVLRGTIAPTMPSPAPPLPNERSTIAVTLLTIVAVALAIAAWSAPVEFYIDHYTRFEHLSWLELRVVYVFLLLKTSAYFVSMTILFRRFAHYRVLAIVVVVAICAYELIYSMGSRIETLSIILGAACLYHFTVRPVTLKAGVLGVFAIASLFSVVEVVRMLDFGGLTLPSLLSEEALGPASEFGAVFFPGYHLYDERRAGSLPPAQILMLFNDLVALLPFVDHEQWNPMYWYARNYFPDAVVPPATVGPIAESAVWGGEVDLAFRAVLIGALYACLMRWFLSRRRKWWALVIYAYLFATCVMTLKYSVLYQLGPLVRSILPGVLLFWAMTRLFASPTKRSEAIRRGSLLLSR
jgi:hypothetical protein